MASSKGVEGMSTVGLIRVIHRRRVEGVTARDRDKGKEVMDGWMTRLITGRIMRIRGPIIDD